MARALHQVKSKQIESEKRPVAMLMAAACISRCSVRSVGVA